MTGAESARVSIIEFSDFQCPFCAAMSHALDHLLQKYPADVRLTFKQFPLPMHSQATRAAEASSCAAEQGKFWDFERLMFADQSRVASGKFPDLAEKAGVDLSVFEACLNAKGVSKLVQSDVSDGAAIGLSSTPAIFINGRLITGLKPYEVLEQIVEEELQTGRRAAVAVQ